ncbi:hypothetical protein [Rhizobium sp. SU303]|uniref:hypothetical protein n=1 Tax=Rhizobium sp. SU303 TaxID=3138065 RepID=UPI001E627C72|nr:hypothetical protein [Rhizobium leguminosarum]UFW79992.1 hypothetical protein RlegSU303_08765 [Rhizobium leguminosarum bv. viciae]
MPRFNYRFTKASTGRANKASRSAYDEAELRAALSLEGIQPIDVEMEPPEASTERQTDYLRDLGVSWSGSLTKHEASDLITNAQERKSPMQPSLGRLARHYRVEVTRYTSKESLYRRICSQVSSNSDGRELAEWFTYRVYRTGCDRHGAMIDHPGDDRLRTATNALLQDDAGMRSLWRAARETDSGFRWFGSFEGDDGQRITGDSRNTACFKLAYGELLRAGLVPSSPRSDGVVSSAIRSKISISNGDETVPATPKSGCLGSLMLLVAAFAGTGYLFF